MNGTKVEMIPKFLEGEFIPEDYFEPVDPYKPYTPGKTNIRKLAKYARENGKDGWTLTKEEIKMFEEKE